ncbi:MAG: MFS transporter [Sporichthyaceae bacterium]
MTLHDAAQVRRRFLVLSATRWLPTGITIPVLVVLLQERGLSLAAIGLLSGLGSAVVALLELPTGGLADALGRRPVLLVAGLFSLASLAISSFAHSVAFFALAWVVEGIYRALDSGPLESWYVDSALAADPDADIESTLSAQSTVLSIAIAGGALAGGGLALIPAPGLPVLALPILVAMALRCVDLAATWRLLDEHRAGENASAEAFSGQGRGLRAAARTVRRSGRTVREAVALVRTGPALLALLAVECLWGAGMTGVELFSGPRMVELLGDADRGVAAYALTAAVAWSISGAGAAAAPWIARRTGSWVRAAIVTRIAQGIGVSLAVVIAGPVGLVLGYAGFYLVHGAANVAHYGLVHRHVGAEHRSTMVSLNSLTSRLGGVIAAPALGALAAGQGLPAAFAVAAILLVLPAPLYALARPPRSPDTPLPPAGGAIDARGWPYTPTGDARTAAS